MIVEVAPAVEVVPVLANTTNPQAHSEDLRVDSMVSWPLSLPEWLVFLLLPLPTVALGLWLIIARQYDGLYGQDPYAYVSYAVGPLRHSLLSGSPLQPMFWPLGYPLPVALASFLLGARAAVGQSISVIAALAAVLFTYLFGRDLLRSTGMTPAEARLAAALGALFLSSSGYLVQAGVTSIADSTALATALLSAWCLVRWLSQPESKVATIWLGLSTGAMVYSTITRWGQAALFAVWLAAVLPTLLRSRRNYFPMRALAAGIPILVILGPQIALSLSTPGGSPGSHAFAGDFSVQGGSWSLLNLFHRSFHNSDGALSYSSPNLLFYVIEPFRTMFLTPLLAPAVVIGAIFLLRQYHRAIVLLLGWPAILLLLDSALAWQDPRFVLAALPPIALLGGLGCVRMRIFVTTRHRWLFIPAVALALIAIAAGASRGLNALASSSHRERTTVQWLEAHIPAHATLLSTEITPALQYRTHLRTVELYQLSPKAVQRILDTNRSVFLALQVARMSTQWATMDPGKDFRYLNTSQRLRTIGSSGGYTLFAVTRSPQSRP